MPGRCTSGRAPGSTVPNVLRQLAWGGTGCPRTHIHGAHRDRALYLQRGSFLPVFKDHCRRVVRQRGEVEKWGICFNFPIQEPLVLVGRTFTDPSGYPKKKKKAVNKFACRDPTATAACLSFFFSFPSFPFGPETLHCLLHPLNKERCPAHYVFGNCPPLPPLCTVRFPQPRLPSCFCIYSTPC